MPSSSFSYSSSWAVPAEQQRNSIGITVESHVYISSETAAGRHRNSSGPAADQQWNITSRLSAEQQRNISGSASAQQRTNIGTAVEPQWSSNSQPSTVVARLVVVVVAVESLCINLPPFAFVFVLVFALVTSSSLSSPPSSLSAWSL